MFSETFPHILDTVYNGEKQGLLNKSECITLMEKGAGREGLQLEEVISLLDNARQDYHRQTIIEFAMALRRPHDREILLLPPLYFDSCCENDCLYCDFNANGKRLSLEEFRQEFETLLQFGYRSIELVSSQDPYLYRHEKNYDHERQLFNAHEALKYFEIAKSYLRQNGGGMLTSNIPPLDLKSFSGLKEAGLDCFLIWLETFNPDQYSRLHAARGPKSNQAFRLNSFERALEAGIEHIAGAFLKGLYDWYAEEAVLYAMDRHLRTTMGQGFSIVGTPRLKGKTCQLDVVRDYSMSDRDYELNIALDRILFDGILWLQTRESFETNRALINKFGGGVILTLTSCTAPGGYAKPAEARDQFPVHSQNIGQSVQLLKDDGFTCHFDWNSDTLKSFQRNVRE